MYAASAVRTIMGHLAASLLDIAIRSFEVQKQIRQDWRLALRRGRRDGFIKCVEYTLVDGAVINAIVQVRLRIARPARNKRLKVVVQDVKVVFKVRIAVAEKCV
jgi:hypothetical protein